MQAMHIITVTNDYLPLAGTGHNTIRKFDGKYNGLMVTDHVVMFHTADPKTVEIIPQTIELLQVSAIAIGTLDMICTHHCLRNHAWRNYEEISAFQEHILSFYPLPEPTIKDMVPERDINEQYCAIYF